ncbi:MAG: lipid-binding SYLF domain-containing protein [Desulfobulbaceae bacterium]|nr:lipid-binding SYLF domain-containing protein [Desulfobulbaceae bacterium]
MKLFLRTMMVTISLFFFVTQAWADKYAETKKMFSDAGIEAIFNSAYGYALFPTIGKAGFVVGGAYGEGRVYEQGKYIGDAVMTQATVGFQIGGSGFSQVVFFQDQRALSEFTNGNFEFGAEISAVALTAAAGAAANTAGSSATASGGKNNANTKGAGYNKGMATYTITKGGAMFEASVGGQNFKFTKPAK